VNAGTERAPRREGSTRLGLTAQGRAVLVLTLAAGLASALAPGFARPLAAVGAATLLLDAFLALACSRGLELGALGPARAPVGSRLVLPLAVRARAGLLAPRDLSFALQEEGGGAPVPAGFLEGRTHSGPMSIQLAWRVRRRGRLERFRVHVTVARPLGLVRVTRVLGVRARILGLPRRGRLARSTEPALSNARSGLLAAGDEEFSHVRDWREGESLHRLHWRTSARRGRPVLREMRAPSEPDVELVLQTRVPGLERRTRPADFERAVSLAATLADHVLRGGRCLALTIEDEAGLRAVRGRRGLARVLERLAEVEARPGPGRSDPVSEVQARSRPRRAREERIHVCAGGGLGRPGVEHDRRSRGPGARIGPRTRVLDVDAPRGHPWHVAWTCLPPLPGARP